MSEFNSLEPVTGLVNRIQRGDKEAFGKIYDLYSPVIFGVITRIVKDEQRAEPLLQAVFLQFWKEAAHYNSVKTSLPLYLSGIARRLALEDVKSTQQNIRNGVNHVYMSGNANFAQLSNEEAENGTAFAMLYFKGYSLEKAAAEFGIDVNELRKKLRTELSALREVKINE